MRKRTGSNLGRLYEDEDATKKPTKNSKVNQNVDTNSSQDGSVSRAAKKSILKQNSKSEKSDTHVSFSEMPEINTQSEIK